MWVVLYHVVSICELPVPARLLSLLDGAHAVDVFILLSGFVIAALRLRRNEPYIVFIARRWLRIFPIYAICVTVAIFFAVVGIMPIRFTNGDLPLLLTSHALLLHGAVPNGLHRSAASAFLNPTWSVSLEWQFYLVAPCLIGLMTRSRAALLCSALLTTALFKLLGPLNVLLGGTTGAFLLAKLPLFWLGAASFLFYQWSEGIELTGGFATQVLATLAVLSAFLAPPSKFLGVMLWMAMLAIVAGARSSTREGWIRQICGFLSRRRVLYLGSISYPLYLCHEPAIWAGRMLTLLVIPGATGPLLAIAVAAFSVPVSICVASLLHKVVELPVDRLGRRLGTS